MANSGYGLLIIKLGVLRILNNKFRSGGHSLYEAKPATAGFANESKESCNYRKHFRSNLPDFLQGVVPTAVALALGSCIEQVSKLACLLLLRLLRLLLDELLNFLNNAFDRLQDT
jgi:hypothetical protein